MKYLINLIIILSLLAHGCHAQKKIKTIEEYKVPHDSIAALVKQAKQDSSNYVGKSFSKFEKLLDKRGLKITQVSIADCDCKKVNPQYVYAITVWFMKKEEKNVESGSKLLLEPFIIVRFTESKPFEKALSLIKQYKGYYNEEVAAFYADAVIKSLYFDYSDDIYLLPHRQPSEQ